MFNPKREARKKKLSRIWRLKTEIPLSLHQECKGTSSNYGFLSFNIFRKGKCRND